MSQIGIYLDKETEVMFWQKDVDERKRIRKIAAGVLKAEVTKPKEDPVPEVSQETEHQ